MVASNAPEYVLGVFVQFTHDLPFFSLAAVPGTALWVLERYSSPY